jgi:predicted XRE-type DNA-binding protein
MVAIRHDISSGNVSADMGFTQSEVEALTAKTALILAAKDTMAKQRLTWTQSARVCGTDQPTFSKVLHGRLGVVTIDRLAGWLTAPGQDVEITIRPAPTSRPGCLPIAGVA